MMILENLSRTCPECLLILKFQFKTYAKTGAITTSTNKLLKIDIFAEFCLHGRGSDQSFY